PPPSPPDLLHARLHDALPIYFNSPRKRPPPHVGDAKIDVIELISSRVCSRGRDCHRIVIDRNHALCSKARRRQRENSRTRPKIEDRKSTRLNSSHGSISYAVF